MKLTYFRKQLENAINQSGLNIEEVYFVFKDVYFEIGNLYNLELQKSKKEEENKNERTIS